MNSDPVAILPAVLGYVNHRHFQTVIDKARTACFNSRQRVDDHFVGINDMIEVGKGAKRPAKSVRYRG
jgi:DNA-damage-inducible protein D